MPRAKDKEAILLFPFICNGVLAVLFRGTIDSTSVNRRGVVTAALRLIRQPYSHHHPSEHPEPREADKALSRMPEAGASVDWRAYYGPRRRVRPRDGLDDRVRTRLA